MDTTLINKTDKYLDNYLRTGKLTIGQTLHEHQIPTDKKENRKIPPFAFLKIYFSQRTFGTFAFAPQTAQANAGQRQKSQIPPPKNIKC